MRKKKQRAWIWAAALWTGLLPHGACIDSDWLEDEKAVNAVQPPAEVMDAIGVKEGMTVGEFGAGYGRNAMPLAVRVGEKGLVYANDISKSALLFLERRCRDAGVKNVRAILGSVDDPLFPKGSLDLAFSARTYHELENPVAFMKNLIPALKPGAAVALIDFDPQKDKDMLKHGRDLKKEVEAAGYEIVKMEKFNAYDVLVILKVKTR